MRTIEQILQNMKEEMPFDLSDNIKEYVIEAMGIYAEEYHQSELKNHVFLDDVSVSSPKIHIVDIDGDIIESLNTMSHAEKLRDAINSDPESITHHYQVMIRDER